MHQIFNDIRFKSFFIVIFVFIVDFFSKEFIVSSMAHYQYLGGVLKINYVKNTGVAFGLFQGANTFFIFFNLILLIFLFYMKKKIKSTLSYYSLHLIIGGAVGNIYDRIKYGYVIDFIDLSFFPAVFNFADFFITLGVCLILFDDYIKKEI